MLRTHDGFLEAKPINHDKKMPQKHRVRNWSAYNTALMKRGDIFLHFDEQFFNSEWHFTGKQRAGGQRKYSDAAIEMILSIKYVLKLPLRQVQGFVESLIRKLELDVVVPDYSTVSRRAKTLTIKVKQYGNINRGESLHLLLDSTGLSVYSGTYFHTNKHLKHRLHKKARSWKKLHIAYDLKSLQVMNASLTDSTVQDAAAVQKLVDLPGKTIASITADKAYDKKACYRKAHQLGAQAIIPPIKTAVIQKKSRRRYDEVLRMRDEAITFIREHPSYEEGLKRWKQNTGYHSRSHIEAVNHRFKRAFGFTLNAKLDETRTTEVIIKLNILNRHMALGGAIFEIAS